MSEIKKVMTENPHCVGEHTNLYKARLLMAEKKVRHLPVKNTDSGKTIGLVTQAALLANTMKIVNQRGIEQLDHEQKSMNVSNIMETNVAIMDITKPLIDVAQLLKDQSCGCVCIESDKQLVGIVSSSDFVKHYIENNE